jgi:PKD repeat protein
MKKILLTVLVLYSFFVSAQSTYPCLHTSFYFNGSQYLQIPTVGTYLQAAPFTVEAWVKTNGSDVKPIIEANFVDGWGVYLDGLNLNFGKIGVDTALIPSTYAVTADTWTHIAVAYTGSFVKFYMNGSFLGSVAYASVFADGTNGDYLIGENYDHTQHFIGDIDEVRVWSGERTAVQIVALKDNEVIATEPGLLLCYRFNEQLGSTAVDEVNPPHTAAMQNGGNVSVGSSAPPECPTVVAAANATCTAVWVNDVTTHYTVDYTDASTNSPTAWNWVFPGGTPATSTDQNPGTVTYDATPQSATLIASNAEGDSSTTVVDNTCAGVGMEDLTEKQIIRLYPNPTNGLITIETKTSLASGKSIYQLYDVTGKVLLNSLASGAKFNLDISAFSKGVYFLTLYDGEREAHGKIIKE